MADKFFQIMAPFTKIENEADFSKLLQQAKHINSIMYLPDCLQNIKMSSVIFENVSFSKTSIVGVSFNECVFKNCLFIYSVFDNVRFHGCEFINCNFFRAQFSSSCYGKPSQFKKAISDKKYSNIAVWLFDQLRLLYKEDSQRSYRAEAEYYFNDWLYVQNYKKKRCEKKWYKFYPKKISLKLYGMFFGYGYKLKNLVLTTSATIILLVILNLTCGKLMFNEHGITSISQSIYFTITTMLTLGASGFGDPTYFGRWIIIINVLLGISLLSFTISALFNRVIK